MTTIPKQLSVSRAFPQETVHVPPSAMAFLWSRTDMLREVWYVVQKIGAWRGVSIRPDANGLCLTLGGVPLGHLGWHGRIDLPFGPQVQDHVLTEEMANLDTSKPETDHLVFDIRTAADVDRAIWLLRLAYLIEDPESVSTCNWHRAITHK